MNYSWSERAAQDPSLRAFIDQEVARAHIELVSLRVEAAHFKKVAQEQQQRADRLALEVKLLKQKKTERSKG